MTKIKAILATSINGVIGLDNKIPWHLPSDFKMFKEVTSGAAVLMGRKCYDSIGRLLPNRKNIIITRNKDLKIEGADIYHNFDRTLLKELKSTLDTDLFIIGGSDIYKDSMEYVDEVYLTLILDVISEGDTFFDISELEAGYFDLDNDKWSDKALKLVESSPVQEEKGTKFIFLKYSR